MNKNNKIIWMSWLQGLCDPHIPKLNLDCINRWKDLNPDWKVNILSNKTIVDYVPEYFEIIKNSPKRLPQACSDLVRILLLSKYGGVWVDASVYPMKPLSDFYHDIVNESGFFSYRFIPRGSYDARKMCETVSWFLCTNQPNHYLIEAWKEQFIKRFKTYNEWPYFTFHETLTFLYDNDMKIKKTINEMVEINEQIPHSAQHRWKDRIESYMYKRPVLDQIND